MYRLAKDLYLRVLTPEETGYISVSTGLAFRVAGDQLRIFEPDGGPMLPTPLELAERAETEKAELRERRSEG